MNHGGDGWESTPFDEDFVRGARFREGEHLPRRKPSRASLREVKREARVIRLPTRRRRRRRILTGAAAMVACALVIALGVHAGESGPRATPRSVPVATHLPTASPSPDDPFAGTAVERWPVGDAGLRPPRAAAVGIFSAAQVGAAYQATSRYLHLALLDPRVLYGGQLDPVYALMSADNLRAWRADASHAKVDGAQIANRFYTDVTSDRPTIKVNGVMSAAAKDDGLWVTYTYVAAYAVRRTGSRPGDAELVAIRREGDVIFYPSGRNGLTKPWIRPSGHTSDHSRCDVRWPHPGFLEVYLTDNATATPTTTTGTLTGAPTPLPTWNMLDPAKENPSKGSCFHNAVPLEH